MGVEIQVGGSWKEAADRTPVGVISAFGGTVAPDGWFLCDGSEKSRTTYADLYAVIGTAFGAGDGTSTFHLPDLRGRFIRGIDGTAGQDPDKATRDPMATGGNTGNAVGSVQGDVFQGHWHSANNAANIVHAAGGGSSINGSGTWSALDLTVRDPTTDGVNGTPRKSAETRPKNAYVNFIIKY